ncbi:MAG: dTDP-4-dehydrorhamnose 3,5-epimerase [Chitinophagaceae bacterium]
MIFTPTILAGSYLIGLEPFNDNRGWFARFFSKDEFKQIGHQKEWLQLNHSMTYQKGTLRGMHFQRAPFSEIKLVRCIAGAVFDVIVDLRKESATFLKWYGAELSEINQDMMYIPEGFAHGFQALTENCQLIYHHSEVYTPQAESGILFNDPVLNIQWPLPVKTLSEKDAHYVYIDSQFKGI